MARREDIELISGAMAYVEAVHIDLTAENTAPPSGVEGRIVPAIRADPALSDYVLTWASHRRALPASVAPPRPPPFDATYERVRELLRRTGDEPRRAPKPQPACRAWWRRAWLSFHSPPSPYDRLLIGGYSSKPNHIPTAATG
jgi:hypothetical protein